MNKNRLAMLILVLTNLLWGGNFVFGKFLVKMIPPWTLAALRWTVASLILLPWAWWQEKLAWPQIKKYQKHLLLMGISGVFLFNSLVYLALKYTTPTNAALISSANPVVIAALAYFLFREKLNRRQLLGLGLSLTGVVWVVSQGSWQRLTRLGLNWGDLTMVLDLFIWTVYIFSSRQVMKEIPVLSATAWSTAIGTVLLYPVAGWELGQINIMALPWQRPEVITGILYIGIFASVLAFIGWNKGVQGLGPARAAVFLNLIPVFAALLSWLVWQQPLQQAQLIGGLLVAGGVYLTNRG
ncbi:Permease of the drug/metabolite transporter (DMT) superfamily [Carboxydocella sporoproducens DSM 16521]|uniref:Permease of the drug/metabolite transporter (DMT) superfamily n=2 Tax=Carboxydocella TaxID=178898 RepID=A0A1T4MEP1_9FIRM|nr:MULTISPECIES: DMT family transporter [Carboxydocella]AVX21300.1 Permease of the drug/metabolite transporter (DMT) superfamily [Carboxydocella thermautotrophica]AVX31731.1 Permease of the drug/metabolite transporter (DMT) superfamily [Carboxydocella thermautotrophica]SJZ65499.1 Permease of the drug/metabolite transporter (DMT) superfamily [Carboxydocella sporoproducens DSM 16521]